MFDSLICGTARLVIEGKLEDAVENLRKRFGRSAINRAVVLRDEGFVGLDIKDSHSLGSLGKNKIQEDEF